MKLRVHFGPALPDGGLPRLRRPADGPVPDPGQDRQDVQAESSADQAQIVSNLYDANLALRNEVATLADQLQQQRDEQRRRRGPARWLSDLEKLRVINGTSPAIGPGVELKIGADIRVEDVQDLINELRNAGAEAVAVNGERVTVADGGRERPRRDRPERPAGVAPYVFERGRLAGDARARADAQGRAGRLPAEHLPRGPDRRRQAARGRAAAGAATPPLRDRAAGPARPDNRTG